MKIFSGRVGLGKFAGALVALFIGLALTGPHIGGAEAEWEAVARIDSIRVEGSEVVVTARVNAAFEAVILEGRTRLSSGSWTILETFYPEAGDETMLEVIFRAPISREAEFLRVQAKWKSFASQFQTGDKSFAVVGSGQEQVLRGGIGVFAPEADALTDDSAAPREVVESDLWRIRR